MDTMLINKNGVPRENLPQFKDFDAKYANILPRKSINVGSLKPTQDKIDINKVRDIYKKQGWINNPLVIDDKNNVVDGHHRWAAAMVHSPFTVITAYIATPELI